MSTTVQVRLSRTVDVPDLLGALAAQGLEARRLNGDALLVLANGDPAAVPHALEGWLVERGLPLVPVQVAEREYVVRPPAG